eukprot:g20372.t1
MSRSQSVTGSAARILRPITLGSPVVSSYSSFSLYRSARSQELKHRVSWKCASFSCTELLLRLEPAFAFQTDKLPQTASDLLPGYFIHE